MPILNLNIDCSDASSSYATAAAERGTPAAEETTKELLIGVTRLASVPPNLASGETPPSWALRVPVRVPKLVTVAFVTDLYLELSLGVKPSDARFINLKPPSSEVLRWFSF